jgi:hypothetical protein
MQRDNVQLPAWSIPRLRGRAHFVLDPGTDGVARPCIWLEPPCAQYLQAGEFWVEIDQRGGGVWWWRFEFAFAALNRAVFALAESRPASAGAPPPQGLWLGSSGPRSRQSTGPSSGGSSLSPQGRSTPPAAA